MNSYYRATVEYAKPLVSNTAFRVNVGLCWLEFTTSNPFVILEELQDFSGSF